MSTLTETLTKYNIESKLFEQQPALTNDMYYLINSFRAWDYLTLFDNVSKTKLSNKLRTYRLYSSFNLETLTYNEPIAQVVDHSIMPLCIHRVGNNLLMESYNYTVIMNMLQTARNQDKTCLILPIKECYHNQFHQTLLVIDLRKNQATYYNPNGSKCHFYNPNDEIKESITSCLESFLYKFCQKFSPNIQFNFREENQYLNKEFNHPEIRYDYDNGQSFLLTFLLSHLLNSGLEDVRSFYALVEELSDIGRSELVYNFASSVFKVFNPQETPESERLTNTGSPAPVDEIEESVRDEYNIVSEEDVQEKEDPKNKELSDSMEKAKSLYFEIERLRKILEQFNNNK